MASAPGGGLKGVSAACDTVHLRVYPRQLWIERAWIVPLEGRVALGTVAVLLANARGMGQRSSSAAAPRASRHSRSIEGRGRLVKAAGAG